ncbi:hypothetical protein JCM6882_006546 [Rhodosporidiobolus microsporus]
MQRYPPASPSLDVPSDFRGASSSHRAPTSPRARTSFSLSSPAPPSSKGYSMPAEHRRTGSGRTTSSGLPLPGGARRGGAAAGWMSGRLRSGRGRWVLLAGVILGVWWWTSNGPTDTVDMGKAVLDAARNREALVAVEPTTTEWQVAPLPPPPLEEEEREEEVPRPARPPPKPAPPPPPSTPADSSAIDVSVHPLTHSSSHRTFDPSERFLAYSPHSGYHNQRISLENAFTLAHLLKRTLLVPPVWFGHAIPYISFDKLQRRLEMASKEGLEHCIPYGDGSAEDPIPRECDGFWDWTTVDWSFLVDLSEAEKLVPLVRRSNLSSAWLDEELSLRAPTKRSGVSPDVYQLKDDTMYQYRFYDSPDDDEPLLKWGNRIDIDDFAAKTERYKLVHVGTLFGTSRLRATKEETYDARSVFRKAMVFRTEVVDEITQQVRDLLGGEGQYYGLHLRVGDGVFQKEAATNMRGVWEKLCVDKMKLDQEMCDEVRGMGEQRAQRRDAEEVDEAAEVVVEDDLPPLSSADSPSLAKRANSRPQREGAFHHAPLPPLPTIRTLADSPLASSLTCRRPLHTAPHLLPFNAPLFIATDSKLPAHDPHLSIFFRAFPCAFVLSNFGHLPALGRLNRLRNEEDKTPLAGFLYPQLDAQIAAWGRGLIGTPQSTYSRFAVDVLHQVYHGWDIVERG